MTDRTEEWSARLDGGHQVSPEAERATLLGAELDVLSAGTDELSTFSRVLRYATDLGREPSAVPRTLVPGLLAQAGSALAGALDDEDWGLAGELLMTWPLLGRTAHTDAAVALRVVQEQSDADPSVLSTDRTALVLALLAALAPRVGWARTEPDLNGPALRDAWLFGDERPTWHDLSYAALPGSAGLAVALVSDARIRRLARDHRFEDLSAALAMPGVPATPMSRQAQELLERLGHDRPDG